MYQAKHNISAAVVLCVLIAGSAWLYARQEKVAKVEPGRLAVVWSSADPDVAHRVCLMYTHGAQKAKWFDQIKLVIWGPSARLLAGDKDLQKKIRGIMADGVQVKACVVCADSYGVSAQLRNLGIEVKPMGKPLSQMLQSDWKVITF